MAGMERFTQRARRVLSLAHQEAERARQNNIGTEHLLLGLMDEEGGVAGRVLRDLGMTSDRVREVVQRVSGNPTTFDPNKIELAAETQQVLEFAVDEARRLGHHYIGTEHILLGTCAHRIDWDGSAAQTRRHCGSDPQADSPRIERNRILLPDACRLVNEQKRRCGIQSQNPPRRSTRLRSNLEG